jgi:hypothetical protein
MSFSFLERNAVERKLRDLKRSRLTTAVSSNKADSNKNVKVTE